MGVGGNNWSIYLAPGAWHVLALSPLPCFHITTQPLPPLFPPSFLPREVLSDFLVRPLTTCRSMAVLWGSLPELQDEITRVRRSLDERVGAGGGQALAQLQHAGA